jgi:hypothetical protein
LKSRRVADRAPTFFFFLFPIFTIASSLLSSYYLLTTSRFQLKTFFRTLFFLFSLFFNLQLKT